MTEHREASSERLTLELFIGHIAVMDAAAKSNHLLDIPQYLTDAEFAFFLAQIDQIETRLSDFKKRIEQARSKRNHVIVPFRAS